MGSGIAQVSAPSRVQTVVREVSADLVEKGLKGIEKNLVRLVEKGTLPEAAKSETRGRLKGTTSLEDLKDCDVIVEAIIEQLPAKRELFSALGCHLRPKHHFREQYFFPDRLRRLPQPRSGRSALSACIFSIRCRS